MTRNPFVIITLYPWEQSMLFIMSPFPCPPCCLCSGDPRAPSAAAKAVPPQPPNLWMFPVPFSSLLRTLFLASFTAASGVAIFLLTPHTFASREHGCPCPSLSPPDHSPFLLPKPTALEQTMQCSPLLAVTEHQPLIQSLFLL